MQANPTNISAQESAVFAHVDHEVATHLGFYIRTLESYQWRMAHAHYWNMVELITESLVLEAQSLAHIGGMGGGQLLPREEAEQRLHAFTGRVEAWAENPDLPQGFRDVLQGTLGRLHGETQEILGLTYGFPSGKHLISGGNMR